MPRRGKHGWHNSVKDPQRDSFPGWYLRIHVQTARRLSILLSFVERSSEGFYDDNRISWQTKPDLANFSICIKGHFRCVVQKLREAQNERPSLPSRIYPVCIGKYRCMPIAVTPQPSNAYSIVVHHILFVHLFSNSIYIKKSYMWIDLTCVSVSDNFDAKSFLSCPTT